MLVSEHIYTHAGWQRPVLMQPATTSVRFAGEGLAALEVSYDTGEKIRRGQGAWLAHDGVQAGYGAGVECGIGGLRVRVDAGGSGRLMVVQVRE